MNEFFSIFYIIKFKINMNYPTPYNAGYFYNPDLFF